MPEAGIEPFKIAISDALLDDLQSRLRATRFLTGGSHGWDYGTDPDYLHALVVYWRDRFDWRAQEIILNRFQHFRADVDGTKLDFIHEKGRGPAPTPLLLTHGFPDSFYRFHKLIPMLADPASHGGDAADAFDVVVPSLPGYAFSEPRDNHGGLFGFGDLLHRLMTDTLGYQRYAAHGGDWGSTITEHIGRSHTKALVGIHLTDVPFWHALQKPKQPTHEEQKYLDAIEDFQKQEGAYALIQGSRPRSLAVGLNDSPAGLADWLVEKFQRWSDCGGDIETRFSKDELLTNIMLYWATQSIETSFQPYRDVMSANAVRWIKEAAKGFIGSNGTPAGFAMFPKDLSHPPRVWAERFFNVQRWTEMPSGGHFAALEEPDVLAEDIRAFFRPLRAA